MKAHKDDIAVAPILNFGSFEDDNAFSFIPRLPACSLRKGILTLWFGNH